MADRQCKAEGCGSRSRAKGFCNKHYLEDRYVNHPREKKEPIRTNLRCRVEGCSRAMVEAACPVHGVPPMPDHEFTADKSGRCSICRERWGGRKRWP